MKNGVRGEGGVVSVQRYLVLEFGSHSSNTAARIHWAGIRSDRSSGIDTAVAAVPTAAAATSVVSKKVGGRSVGVQQLGTSIAISYPPTRLHYEQGD